MKRQGNKNTKKQIYVVAFALLSAGLALIFVSIIGRELRHWPESFTAFARDVGLLLAAVMGATILHEELLREEMFEQWSDDLEQQLDQKVPKLHQTATETANAVHHLFCEHPPQMTGLRLMTKVRRNSAAYYSWVIEQQPQELFFAGRSVLHRIDADIRARMGSSAEDVIFRRLMEGSRITILLLDPRIDFLKRLAEEEGEPWQSLLGNVATSIGVCKRLYALLEREMPPPGARLTIRIYDEIPYFAYHQQDKEVVIGFYFRSLLGSSSAAYEVLDEVTKNTFKDHFVKIGAAASGTYLIEFDGARGEATFNDGLFEELCAFVRVQLGDKADDLIKGAPGFWKHGLHAQQRQGQSSG